MKNMVRLVEIPAKNFDRAVQFYSSVFDVKIDVYGCDSDSEQMGFLNTQVAISRAKDFTPSNNGVLVSIEVDEVNQTLQKVEKNGGKTLTPKTKIEAEGLGYFANFTDCEGNRLGLYSDK